MSQSPAAYNSSKQSELCDDRQQAIASLTRSGKSWSGHERHCCFLNTLQQAFADVSFAAGFDFLDDGQGLAVTDWDADGDLDVLALCVDSLASEQQVTRSLAELLVHLGVTFAADLATEATVTRLQEMVDELFFIQRPLSVPFLVLLDAKENASVIYRGKTDLQQILNDARSSELSTRPPITAHPFSGE